MTDKTNTSITAVFFGDLMLSQMDGSIFADFCRHCCFSILFWMLVQFVGRTKIALLISFFFSFFFFATVIVPAI